MIHPEAERLAGAWIRHFWSSNHTIEWTHIEQEHSLWLNVNTVLVGKMDGRGISASGEPFVLENKSASKSKARFIDDEKARWRMSPQSLTYGVLCEELASKFTVRWAFKTEPATCDFEWYTYTPEELAWWRNELQTIANQIRALRAQPKENWPVNLLNCTRYGEKYKCPFRDGGCWRLKFDYIPDTMKLRTESHLAIENELKSKEPFSTLGGYSDFVVLDASRVGDWMACNELYRRMWEKDALTNDNEDLKIGHDFHQLIAAHLTQIKENPNVVS